MSAVEINLHASGLLAARLHGSNYFKFTPRCLTVLTIFLVSLCAISFPCLPRRLKTLRIPHLVFFIAKHFGTGVILSTAFCHLLPDAFESLQDHNVNEAYHNIGKWAGLIILCSLLIIFLVEYISTSYVDYLYAKPSLPPTPTTSSFRIPPANIEGIINSYMYKRQDMTSTTGTATPSSALQNPSPNAEVTEVTPLLANSQGRPKSRSFCESDSCKRAQPVLPLVFLNSPRLSRGGLPLSGMVWGRDMPCACRLHFENVEEPENGVVGVNFNSSAVTESEEAQTEEETRRRVGRRRQIIGILVLQVGIMIHSLVIGLTLSVTSGSDFTSLLTAVLFHQLFEGLSLGIRIAGIPAPPGRTLDLELPNCESDGKRTFDWLSPTLFFLFAVTTPFGMVLGMLLINPCSDICRYPENTRMVLVQGLMSGISAGMLIYAATVEMLAGDFVFSDVGGEHEHSNHHSHHSHSFEVSIEDTPCQGENDVDNHQIARRKTDRPDLDSYPSNPLKKRVLAVISLLIGAAAMAMVGF